VEQKNDIVLWKNFATQHDLSAFQIEQFVHFYKELIRKNADFNMTAITDLESVIDYHFSDSLALGKSRDMKTITSIVDVGCGAGFPCIPLKIAYPHLQIIAIEVNNKKADFLEAIARDLRFEQYTVSRLDYRTFLRKAVQLVPLDMTSCYVCARASLEVDELMRMFRGSSLYRMATLVYWAAHGWESSFAQQQYIVDTVAYVVGSRKRKLVFFRDSKSRNSVSSDLE